MGLIAIAALGLVVLSCTGVLSSQVMDVAEGGAAYIAAISCLLRARRDRNLGWALISLACLAWGIGESVWCWFEFFGHDSWPFPSIADVPFATASLLLAVGMSVLAASYARWVGRIRLITDGLMVAMAVVLVLRTWALSGLDGMSEVGGWGRALVLAYPGADVVCLAVVMLALFTDVRRRELWVLALGSSLLIVADSLFAYETMSDRLQDEPFSGSLWLLGFLCMGWAAWVASRRQRPSDATASSALSVGTAARLPRLVLVHGSVGGAALMVLWRTLETRTVDLGVVICGVLLVGAVIIAQVVSALETVSLQDDMARTLAELARSEERFRSAFVGGPIGIAVLEEDGRFVEVNDALADMVGYTPVELVGRTVGEITHPEDLRTNLDHMHRFFAGEIDQYRLEKRYLHRNGEAVWVAVTAALVPRPGGGRFMIGHVENITDQRAVTERLAYLAEHDPLTGLANRVQFVAELERSLDDSGDGVGPAVLFLDLDRFKEVNDSLGHDVGDLLLVEVARRLISCVGPMGLVGRFGGDEFTVLLREVVDADVVTDLGERIVRSLSIPLELSGSETFITASVGTALRDDSTGEAEDLLRDADAAMYVAKEHGRNRVARFDRSIRDRTVARLDLANELHRALERGQFRVHYQPVIDLGTGDISGFEALVRWAHPVNGIIEPGAFISVAEDTGLIVPIGSVVLNEACRQAAAWTGIGSSSMVAAPSMAVNLSARQLMDSTIVDSVTAALAASGLDPDQLVLEITESSLMSDTHVAAEVLGELRALGVHIAVDDFGTGYSSLTYLKRFPVECLKIDRSFVDGLGSDAGDTVIVEALVALARALGIESVAEGVETVIQLEHLRAIGCDRVQGYLFGRPRDARAVEADLMATAGDDQAESLTAGAFSRLTS